MAEQRLFGNSIDASVVAELARREKLLSKTADNNSILTDEPLLQSLKYTTQRGAWMRMISSVDVFDSTTSSFSSDVAKAFILTGGEINSALQRSEGIDFENFSTSKIYRRTSALGVRPEAGVTSFKIQHKGSYGSLREADVTFNVWSKEDLEKAQNVYLRPGVHIIVEWGHTISSDTKPTALPSLDNYFQESKRETIQNIINTHKASNLSYDGFIGLVTNFSWSFRQDGGYDCSVKIVSAGAILEGLTTIQGANVVSKDTLVRVMKVEDNDKEKDEYKKSFLHSFVAGVKREPLLFDGGRTNSGKITFQGRSLTIISKEAKQRFPTKVDQLLRDNQISVYGFSVQKGEKRYFRYITIRDLLKFLNACEFFPVAPNGEKPTTFHIEGDVQDKTPATSSLYSKFKTFPEHFSLDITTCYLPKPPTSETSISEKDLLETIRLSGNLGETFLQACYANQSDNIQSILIELDFLRDTFEGALSSTEEGIYTLSVLSFMEALLQGVNLALGEITDLNLHFDEKKQQYIIVDRERPGDAQSLSSVAKLSYTGLSNVVQEVSIQTKITPQLSSQIAISAQGTSSISNGNNNNSLPFIQWNRGIKDRFAGKTNSTEEDTNPTNFIDDFLKPWCDGYKALNDGEPAGWFGLLGNRTIYKADLFSKLRRFGIAYFRKKYFESIGGQQKEDDTSDPGLIPIELSMTLDGIGGLKIGEVFQLNNIDKFLPEVYKDYGFIIVGLDNAIENNRWNTTVRALTFKIPKPVTISSTLGAADINSVRTYITNVPWSAGFISYVVRQVIPTFPSRGLHTEYAQALRDNPQGWQILNPADNRPMVGDIIIKNVRKGNPLSFTTARWTGASHGDIVVGVAEDLVTYVGGNLSDTVRKLTVRSPLPNTYFVILRPPQPSRTGIIALANTQYNKWNRQGWLETTPAAYSIIYEYYKAGGIHRLKSNNGIPLTPLPAPNP